MFALFIVLYFIFNLEIKLTECQCYSDSDISIYQSEYSLHLYQEASNQCLGNFTLFNEFLIDNTASKGITCSKKNSTAEGEWKFNNEHITCGHDTSKQVNCERMNPGSITLYTHFKGMRDDWSPHEGNYTCCIEGLCITARIYQVDTFASMFSEKNKTILENCTISLSADTTVIPQQYMVQMNTSGVPPARISSFINCTNGNGITCGESYYTLIDLQDERYQFTVPVTWDPLNTTEFTNHYYECSVLFGGRNSIDLNEPLSSVKTTEIKTPISTPSDINYAVVNATTIYIKWNYISDDVNGFIINITTGQADNTVIKQVTEGKMRGLIITDLLCETNYTIEVRGYYELLGPPARMNVFIEVGITSMEGFLLEFGDDLMSIQEIQVNCFTVGINPNEVTWSIDSASINKNLVISNGSELLTDSADLAYRHYIILNVLAYNDERNISCGISFDKKNKVMSYTLKVDTNPQLTMLMVSHINTSAVFITWSASNSSFVVNYILQYTRLCDNTLHNQLLDSLKNSTIVTELFSGLQYSFKLIPANILQFGRGMKQLIYLHSNGPPNGSPQNISYVQINATSVRLKWVEVDCTKWNGNITGYVIQYLLNNYNNNQTLILNEVDSLSANLSGFIPGQMYSVHIAAMNTIGTGPFDNITIKIPSSSSSSAGSTAAVIGSVLGIVIVITVILIITSTIMFLVFKRYRSLKPTVRNLVPMRPQIQTTVKFCVRDESALIPVQNTDGAYAEVSDNAFISIGATVASEENIEYEPIDNDLSKKNIISSSIPVIQPILTADLGVYVFEWHKNFNAGFKSQFETLYKGEDKSCEIGTSDENKLLNRFKNITVYDDNRIILNPIRGVPLTHKFINAGYVDGYTVPRKFIATQGPIAKTVGDFWYMIWQENVQCIVMLTNLMEDKKNKCARYWPEYKNVPEMFGPFTITVLEENAFIHFTIRKMEVMLNDFSKTLIVDHHQYTTWPDYGVPESVSPFMALKRQTMKKWKKNKSGPMTVHCSAGVGRTGTFIAVDIATEQINKERRVDVAGIITRLRQQRINMVQTSDQYAFIHDALLEGACVGTADITASILETVYTQWKKVDGQTGKTQLDIQFELLSQVTPQPHGILRQTAEQFPEKNRSDKFLPYEKWRVPLQHVYPDYIHASFVHGYRQPKAFIIAQSPMESTVKDFWKMVTDFKVPAIVMCCNEIEKGIEVCSMYWLSDDSESTFGVKIKTENHRGNVIERVICVLNTETKSSYEVTQFQIMNWSKNEVMQSPLTVLDVIEDMIKVQQKRDKGPVVVHCSDTVSRSGVFCAVCNAIEQCKTEGQVSVFQATKAVRMNKPGAVQTLMQYNAIYELILTYLERNSTYSNFKYSN